MAAVNSDGSSNPALFDQYVVPQSTRSPLSVVRAEGSTVWDADGQAYLDFCSGRSGNILGYSPPAVVEAIHQQADQFIRLDHHWQTSQQLQLAQFLCERSFGKAMFCNSGSEANEAALKLARLHAADSGRYRTITFEKGFHGHTWGALTASSIDGCHEGLGPMMAGFRYAALNDLTGVEALIDDETCAIIVEPIQTEGGIRLSEVDFLAGLRALCDEHRLLLIFDETQTGMGRTGQWFSYQHADIQPDIVTLGSEMAGGIASGAMIVQEELSNSWQPSSHLASSGQNSIAIAAAIATGQAIENNGLLNQAEKIAELFHEHLSVLQDDVSLIKDVRICGAMVGIELNLQATPLTVKAQQQGVLFDVVQDTVIRLLPALTMTTEEIASGMEVIGSLLQEMSEEAA